MPYRLYKPEDFAELYAIEEVCFTPPFRFDRRMMRRLAERVHAATWIAEEDDRMTGFAIVEWSGVAAYIETIEVLPEWRGRGIAGELLRRLENSARTADARVIWLHVDAENTPAVRLYEKHGYRYESREESFYPQGRAGLVYAKLMNGAKTARASTPEA